MTSLASLLSSFPPPSAHLSSLFTANAPLQKSLAEFLSPVTCSSPTRSNLAWIMQPDELSLPFNQLSLTTHPLPVLDLPQTPPLLSSPPAPAPLHPSTHSITSFHALNAHSDDLTQSILILLTSLVQNAQQRVATVSKLNQLRLERDTVLQLEFAAQQRSRELLSTCRREMALQDSWTAEIKELYSRAEGEGLDVSGAPRGWSEEGKAVDDEERERIEREWEEASREWSVKKKLREERSELYRRQLSYLSHSLTTSSHRTSTLLTRLSSSSTSLTTRAELSRLHQLTRSTSDTLDQLAVEREETGSTLGRLGEERERTEEEVEGWVLEWVLGWEERRRDAKKRRVGLYK